MSSPDSPTINLRCPIGIHSFETTYHVAEGGTLRVDKCRHCPREYRKLIAHPPPVPATDA